MGRAALQGQLDPQQRLAGRRAILPFRVTFDKWEDDHPVRRSISACGAEKLTFASAAKDNPSSARVDRGAPRPRRPRARATVRVTSTRAGEGPVYAGLYIAIEDPADEM